MLFVYCFLKTDHGFGMRRRRRRDSCKKF